MKKPLVTLLFLFFTITNLYAQELNMEIINGIIDDVKTKYAPDKRTAIFEVNIKEDNNEYVLSGETNI